MATFQSASNVDSSEPKLVSFSTLTTIARKLPRYRQVQGGGSPGTGSGPGGGGGGREKKLTRNATNTGALVTLDMVNGKLVTNIHGISLIQVKTIAVRHLNKHQP